MAHKPWPNPPQSKGEAWKACIFAPASMRLSSTVRQRLHAHQCWGRKHAHRDRLQLRTIHRCRSSQHQVQLFETEYWHSSICLPLSVEIYAVDNGTGGLHQSMQKTYLFELHSNFHVSLHLAHRVSIFLSFSLYSGRDLLCTCHSRNTCRNARALWALVESKSTWKLQKWACLSVPLYIFFTEDPRIWTGCPCTGSRLRLQGYALYIFCQKSARWNHSEQENSDSPCIPDVTVIKQFKM